MSSKETKEAQQKKLDNEKYKRDKQLAILKASNQMLDEAEEGIRQKWADDPVKMDELIALVEMGKSENIAMGKNILNANESEIENATFKEANNVYVEKYNRHLQAIGKTDDEMHEKSTDGITAKGVKVTASAKTKKEKNGKWFSFSKKKVETNTEGEEEITEIDQKKRTVVGEGYVSPMPKEENPDRIMKNIIEKETQESPKTSVKSQTMETKNDINSKIEEKVGISRRETITEYPDFDPSSVNPLTRYDIIELPSHGECYPHKKGRIPVRELTASDENLIASPNMYANGQLVETILKRCILDKNFNVDEICPGDRDAVVMWLRATAYGPEYNVKATNPANGKEYKTTINLGDFQYKEFTLKGDENGYFDFMFDNGDVAKFKILSYKDTQKLQEDIVLQYINQKKYIVYKKINDIKYQVDEVFKSEENNETLMDAIDYIYEWANNDSIEKDETTLYSNFMTSTLIRKTVSINGKEDRDFIEEYINNLRIGEAQKYRDYISENTPGIDFSLEIEMPESDGGGSFKTNFQYGETIFIS